MPYNINKRNATKILCLIILAILLIICIIGGKGLTSVFSPNEFFISQLINDCIPFFYNLNGLDKAFFNNFVVGFDISSPLSIIKSNILVFASVIPNPDDNIKNEENNEVQENAMPIKETKITTNGQENKVIIKNATSYSIDVDKMLNESLSFELNTDEPLILIVHSHSSEAYTSTDRNYYLPTDPDRTENTEFNVVRVGSELCKELNSNGIKTVHIKKLHDYPSYNGSYKNSLASVEEYLKKYPSIKIVLDIHRDSMLQADGTKLKLVYQSGEKKAAQIMLLTGSDQGGLYHPNWYENLKFATKLQKVICDMYPGFARPISFTKERYNTHTTAASVIIEVGTTGNTLEEAIESANLLASSIHEFIRLNK